MIKGLKSTRRSHIVGWQWLEKKMKPKTVLTVWMIGLVAGVICPAAAKHDESVTADSRSAVAAQDQDYRIGIGDNLEISVWKEPDLSLKDVPVRLDGKITFPLLDDIQAAGKTSIEVKQAITEKLGQFVPDPIVTVFVKAPLSQKFYILGEIQKTGEYQLIKNLTVLQAFALAGGFTQWASKDEILVLRREKGNPVVIRVNYKNIQKGKDLDQDIAVMPDDTIIVP